MSRFLRRNFDSALATKSEVSAAKPTSVWFGRFFAPNPHKMSGVGSSTMFGTPPSFLILPSEHDTGRKSATAAAITRTSVVSHNRSSAPCMSAAVSTDTTRVPCGAGRSTVETNVTHAPRRTASAATAYPCFPLDRLAITRTASMGSRVPPAVTTT